MRYKWTTEKIKLLYEHYPIDSWDDLFRIFQVNKKQPIIDKASELKINRQIYNNCRATDQEIKYILDNYQNLTAHEMARVLNRNATFVCRILARNNLTVKNRGIKTEDKSLFIQLYPHLTNKLLSERYFPYLDRKQIRCQAKKFSLRKSEEKTIKWYDKEVLLLQLQQVYDNIGRIPLLREFKSFGLPSEATFRRYFGGVTEAFKMINIERNIINNYHVVYYDHSGNACFSKAELEISNYLIELGVIFEKEVCYKQVLPIEEVGNHRFDWSINRQLFIEYFGLINHDDYKKEVLWKQDVCQRHKICLLSLYPSDFNTKNLWKEKILKFIK